MPTSSTCSGEAAAAISARNSSSASIARRTRPSSDAGKRFGCPLMNGLIPAGTGLAYHNQRRRNASGLTEAEVDALAGGSTNEPATPAAPVMIEESNEDSSAS